MPEESEARDAELQQWTPELTLNGVVTMLDEGGLIERLAISKRLAVPQTTHWVGPALA
jgi:hypothetical protein